MQAVALLLEAAGRRSSRGSSAFEALLPELEADEGEVVGDKAAEPGFRLPEAVAGRRCRRMLQAQGCYAPAVQAVGGETPPAALEALLG